MGFVSSHVASGLTNSTSSPDGCVQDAQFAPNTYTFAELPFSCVSEANDARPLPSSSVSNDTDFAMENCSFKRRTKRLSSSSSSSSACPSSCLVVAFLTSTTEKSGRRRRRFPPPRFICFRDERTTPVVVVVVRARRAVVVMACVYIMSFQRKALRPLFLRPVLTLNVYGIK